MNAYTGSFALLALLLSSCVGLVSEGDSAAKSALSTSDFPTAPVQTDRTFRRRRWGRHDCPRVRAEALRSVGPASDR